MDPTVPPLSLEELEAILHRHLSIEKSYHPNSPEVGQAFLPLVSPYFSDGPHRGDRNYLAHILRLWNPQVDRDYFIGGALFEAINLGDTVALQMLLDAGVDLAIDQGYEPHFPPLLAAAYHGHLAIAQMLWEQIGPEGRFKSEQQAVSCLVIAARNGQSEVLAFFLDAWNGWTTKEKNSALIGAAGVRWDNCVAVLLAKLTYGHEALQDALQIALGRLTILPEDEVDFDRRGRLGNPTPEELAAGGSIRQYRVVCQLVDAGANPNGGGHLHDIPKLFNAITYTDSIGGLKALLEKGVNPNLRYRGSTVLDSLMAEARVYWGPGDCACLRVLLEAGASPDAEDESGETPLQKSATNGNLELFQLCLSRSKAENPAKAVNTQGESLLHKAAARGREDIVEFLVSEDLVDVNLASQNGWTPLMCALSPSAWKTEETASRMANLLLEHGANVQVERHEGWSLLHALASWSQRAFTGRRPFHRRRNTDERGPLLGIARELIRRGAPLDTRPNVLLDSGISTDRLQDVWGFRMQTLAEDVAKKTTGETERCAVTGVTDTTPVAWAIRTGAMDLVQVFFSCLSPSERNITRSEIFK